MVRAEGSERAGLRQAGRGGLEGCYRRSLWKTHKRAPGRLAPDEAGYAKSAMRRPGRGGIKCCIFATPPSETIGANAAPSDIAEIVAAASRTLSPIRTDRSAPGG
jgi:hypothetical protein